VINGPASAPYDEDKGTIILNEWYHVNGVDELYVAASTGGPPPAQNGLINGTNVYGDGGKRFQTTVTAGKSYRLRVINTAMDSFFKFGIDNHTLTVIAADLVPIVPYTTDYISLGIGQRYDVIVTADQTPGNYWMRSIPQTACSSTNEMTLNITGYFNYDSVDIEDPTTTMWPYNDSCDDELSSNLVPYVALDAGGAGVTDIFDITLVAPTGLFRWAINDNTFLSNWSSPSKSAIMNEYRF
jgi:FtsP/CotA-like multicopper oxidase with cupredoxin domain